MSEKSVETLFARTFRNCGGWQVLILSYEDQLAYKATKIKKTISSVWQKMNCLKIEQFLGAPKTTLLSRQ